MATFQSTLADIQNTLQLGLIDNNGVANALAQEIQAASTTQSSERESLVETFAGQVVAQSGKHITGVAPQVLLQDAHDLLGEP
jgi:hypothetical protein